MSWLKKLFAKRAPGEKSARLTRLVSAGPELRGDLYARAAGYFGATLTGNLYADAPVWIDAGGEVRGDLRGKDFGVEGTVRGDVYAGGEVAVKSGGAVRGDIFAGSLLLAPGARFDGLLAVGDEEKNLPLNLKTK